MNIIFNTSNEGNALITSVLLTRSDCITVSSLTSGRFHKLPNREFQLTLPNYVIRSLHTSDSSKRPFEGMLLFYYFGLLL